jgi:hypothetical protein
MKKTLLLFLLLPIFGFAQVDLVKWDAANTNRNTPTYVNTLYPTASVADFTTSGVQAPDYNTNWDAPNSFFIIGGWPNPQQNEGSYDANKYIEFKITPNASNKIDLSAFNFTYRSQGGTPKFQIQYSKDNTFTKNVKVLVPETSISTSWKTITPAFSPEINPVLPEEIVYVRVYVYSANDSFHFITSTNSTGKPATITGTVSAFDSTKILAINDYVSTTKGVGLNISPLSNDVKKENVTAITISTPPLASQGSAILNPDKTITFNPAKNFTGKATFKYTISDGSNSSEGSIEVNVADVTSGSLVIWNAKTSSDLYKPTVNSSFVTAANVSRIGTSTTIEYNNNEDVINPFYSTTSWPNTNTIDQTKYVEFKMTADANHKVDLSTFAFIYRVQGGNTQKIRISYSKNSTPSTTDKVLLADSVTPKAWTTITPAFASDLNTLLAGETVYIRVYIYNSNDAFQFRTKTAINGSIKDTNTLLANNDDISTPVNQSVNVPILLNDVVGSSAIQQITVTQPTNGTVTVNSDNKGVTFTPGNTFTGTTSFTYTLRNANSNYSSATVGVLGTAPLCAASNTAGNNYWKGYVYTYTGAPDPTTYVGSVAENPLFDRNVGNGTITGDTSVEANAFCGTVPSDKFFVRYLMKATTTAGIYNITVGADDGVRLYIDGTLVPFAGSSWSDHSYVSYSTQYTFTAGSHDFVLEYYENAGASRVSFSYGLIKGDPTVFGTNVWNVYGYTSANFSLPAASYVGTYVDSNLNVDTTKYWAKEKSPSSGTGWDGAPMPIDNFTISYKRKGFPCGRYNIQVVNCDDDIQIYIDGVATPVYTAGGNINTPVIINSNAVYTLNKDSKVEIRMREDAGDAKMAINFIDVPVTYNGTGTVNANTSIIITNDTTLSSNIEVCSCTVNAGKTFKIPVDKVLKVNENITVGSGGKLLVQNGGSLLQTNKNAIYTGTTDSFELQRTTQAIRRLDFTYWSSPVTLSSGFTLKKLSPNTAYNKYQKYDPNSGWVSIINGEASMVPGVGYSVRGPEENAVASVYNASFIGVPNNGDINVTPIAEKWNLVGNPYPSSLDAAEFIKNNNGNTTGSLYFWTHNSPPAFSDPNQPNRYFYTTDDYAVFNLTGSVATGFVSTGIEAPSDKSAANNAPNGKIASGQAFFVKALTTTPLKFTNDMRLGGSNTQFFKAANSNNVEEGRLWLNFTNKGGAFKQTLVGYIENATNDFENNYDAPSFNANAYIDFYSVNDTRKLAIQGRAVPFDDADQIPLGYKSTISGEFTISIDRVEGLLNDEAIYLEDKITNKVQDLRKSDYNFKTEIGTFVDRFVLRYKTDKTLGTGDFENLEHGISVSVKNKTISVLSSKENIRQVIIYDITGKVLYNKKKVASTELQIQNLPSGNQVLLIKIALENDFTTTKKTIFQ